MTESGEKFVRVRGGPDGVRHIPMSQWRGEIEERKNEKPVRKSNRQLVHEAKHEARKARKARNKDRSKPGKPDKPDKAKKP